MALAGGIHGRRVAAEAVDFLGHEALVPSLARGLDLRFAAAASGLGLGNQAAIGLSQLGVGEKSARLGRAAAGQIEIGGGRPLIPEHIRDAVDGLADQRYQRLQ